MGLRRGTTGILRSKPAWLRCAENRQLQGNEREGRGGCAKGAEDKQLRPCAGRAPLRGVLDAARACIWGMVAGSGWSSWSWGYMPSIRISSKLRPRPVRSRGLGPGGFVRGDWGEEAEVRVEGGLFDGFGLGLVFFGLGEGLRGDLQGVEEEAGAAVVEGHVGDAGDDLVERELDRGAVFDRGELEGLGVRRGGVGDAAVLVEVAEVLATEAGRLAAAAGGQDVAALVADRCFGWHGYPPPGVLVNYSKEKR